MSQNQGDFTPPVKAGYKADGSFHRRNWRALSDFLRTNFVTNDRLADGSVGEAKIQDLAVTNAKIESLAVDKLTAGSLQADVVLGSVIKTAETGQRVEIDANGIRLTDGTDDVVNIPITGDSSFTGGVTASSLRSSDATLAGDTTIDGSGHMRFSAGVANPTVAPTISWTYSQVSLSGVSALRGIDYDATSSRLLGCYPAAGVISGWPLAGGARDWQYAMAYTPYGITRLGAFIYVSTLSSGNVIVYKFHLDGSGEPDAVQSVVAFARGTAPFGNFDHLAGMTNDGTDVYVCYVKNNGNVVLVRINTSLVWQSEDTLEAGFETADRHAYDIEHQTVDGGTWWLAWDNNSASNYFVRAYNVARARLAAEDFALPGNSQGVCYSGAAFITTPSNAQYYRTHSTWRSSFSYEHVKYSWRDTGGGFESLPSKQAYVAYVQRAFLRVSWSRFPGSADAARVYMLENNVTATPGAGAMFRQGTEATSAQTYSTFNGAGGADPVVSTFPSATPARLTLPVKNGAPASPETGEIYFDSGTTKARVWDGAAWNALW